MLAAWRNTSEGPNSGTLLKKVDAKADLAGLSPMGCSSLDIAPVDEVMVLEEDNKRITTASSMVFH